MSLRFGTDGVRGPADELTDVLVSALGRAAATVLGAGSAMTRIRLARQSVSQRVTIASGSRRYWSNLLARVRALRPGKMRSRNWAATFCAGVRAGMRAMDRGTAPAEKSTVMTPLGPDQAVQVREARMGGLFLFPPHVGGFVENLVGPDDPDRCQVHVA